MVPPSADPQALTGVLYKALTDPARLREMGAASFQIVDVINLEGMVDAFSQAIAAALRLYETPAG